MTAFCVDMKSDRIKRIELNGHSAFQRKRKRHAHLIEIDHESIAGKGCMAAPNGEFIGGPLKRSLAAFRHRPTLAALAEQDHIDRAMIFRPQIATPPLPFVIGRKNASDEEDDRQAIGLVVAECVDIPPAIAARRDGRIEVQSAIKAETALRPDNAAIGTPAPG